MIVYLIRHTSVAVPKGSAYGFTDVPLNQQIAVFAHGGILTCARVHAGEYPIEQAFESIPPYGSVIRIEL